MKFIHLAICVLLYTRCIYAQGGKRKAARAQRPRGPRAYPIPRPKAQRPTSLHEQRKANIMRLRDEERKGKMRIRRERWEKNMKWIRERDSEERRRIRKRLVSGVRCGRKHKAKAGRAFSKNSRVTRHKNAVIRPQPSFRSKREGDSSRGLAERPEPVNKNPEVNQPIAIVEPDADPLSVTLEVSVKPKVSKLPETDTVHVVKECLEKLRSGLENMGVGRIKGQECAQDGTKFHKIDSISRVLHAFGVNNFAYFSSKIKKEVSTWDDFYECEITHDDLEGMLGKTAYTEEVKQQFERVLENREDINYVYLQAMNTLNQKIEAHLQKVDETKIDSGVSRDPV